jgi:hypothetical protein
MKVGFIVEGGPDSADKQVCEYLAKRIGEEEGRNLSTRAIPLGNKRELIRDCGKTACRLLKEGCERILVVWDLYPAWREDGEKPCREKDREEILKSLRNVGISLEIVKLVCIREELEAWLIADGQAISEVLSRPTHPVRVGDETRPERVRNPKKALQRIFREKRNLDYNDRIHAVRIAQAMRDFGRIRKVCSFKRFSSFLCDDKSGESGGVHR